METVAACRSVQVVDGITSMAISSPRVGNVGPSSAFFGNAGVFERSKSGSVRMQRKRVVVEAKIREIFMPALSSTMTEGKIVSWVKSEGDKLNKGESVVVVESDKADMDVETFYNGYLACIVVGEGEVAPVGAAIGLLAESEEEIAEAKAKAGGASAPAPAAAAPPSAVEQAAVAPAPPAPATPPPVISAPAPAVVSSHPAAEGGRIVATPYAKKLAKQHKVDLATITGSGPLGRIVSQDVEAAAGIATAAPVAAAPVAPPSAPPAAVSQKSVPPPAPAQAIVPGTTVPFTSMQNGVARNMVESLNVPTFRVGYTITTTALDALYKQVKSKGVTMTALLAKAAALALAKHPIVNASCKDGKSFTYNSNINIAVAVAMDGGLLTPVLQDADKVDIYSLSRKWKELVGKARAKQLTPAEYNSGTFTLSNLGMFGVDRFDAILPPNTGAIMAVGASQPTVVATKDGLFGVKNQMQVNVTADHRIIYGGDLAEFLQTFAAICEDPKDLVL
ncbi:hypothetical protein R1sor_015663 [Riccia sorocarpa]|uniref:Dihydrolipoamide acetyltransferase component of pyruvate dehydrogenase complex n=1 Tax=Riccia sorocarpa TaxID=122646 RepID=A0ABD3HFW4_9MARC